MATHHSTETTAKLFKAIRPETDTRWVLCVMRVYVKRAVMCGDTRCVKAKRVVAFVSELASSARRHRRPVL